MLWAAGVSAAVAATLAVVVVIGACTYGVVFLSVVAAVEVEVWCDMDGGVGVGGGVAFVIRVEGDGMMAGAGASLVTCDDARAASFFVTGGYGDGSVCGSTGVAVVYMVDVAGLVRTYGLGGGAVGVSPYAGLVFLWSGMRHMFICAFSAAGRWGLSGNVDGCRSQCIGGDFRCRCVP